jgi:hypothetical protein
MNLAGAHIIYGSLVVVVVVVVESQPPLGLVRNILQQERS